MANKRDVELVIRARNESKKALSEVAAALQELTQSQDQVSRSAAKTDSLLDRLGREFVELDRQVRGLSVMGKVAAQMDAAAASATRLENAVARSKNEARESIQAYGQFAQFVNKLKAETLSATDALARQKIEIDKTKSALDQLKGRQTGAAASFKVFEQAEIQRLRTEIKPLAAAAKEAEAALRLAKRQEDLLRQSAVSSTQALMSQRKELGSLRAEMVSVSGAVKGAQAAYGGIALNQEEIARASAKAATQVDRVAAALEKQRQAGKNAQQTSVSSLPQSDELRSVFAARSAFSDAQKQVAELGRQMRATQQPTEDLRRSYLLAQAAVKDANAEYRRQIGVLAQVDQAARGSFAAFDQRARAIGSSTAATNASSSAADRATRSEYSLRDAIRGVTSARDKAAASSGRFLSALEKSNSGQRQALSFAQRLRSELIALATAYVGFYGAARQIGGVVQAFQSIEAVENRLGGVFSQDTNRVAQEVSFLRSEALRLGVSFQVLGDEYSKLAVATKAANFTQEDTRKIFTSVAEAGRVNKLSVEQMRGVFLALQQMVSKGKVTSEELRRQLGDRLPGAFNIMADALGKTTMELDSAMKKGEVFANRSTMIAFADELNRRFGSQLPTALESLTTQIGRFQAIMFDLQVQVAEAGFAEDLRVALTDLNAALTGSNGKAAIQAISDALSGLVKVLVFTVENFGLLSKAVQIFLTYKLAGVFLDVTVSILKSTSGLKAFGLAMADVGKFTKATFATLRADLVAANTGMLTLSGATAVAGAGFRSLTALVRTLAVTLGPVGLTFIALSAAMELITGWESEIDKTNTAIRAHGEIMTEVRAAYVAAKGDVKKWADEIKNVTAFEVQRKITAELERQAEAIQDLRVNDDALFDYRGVARQGRNEVKALIDAYKEGKLSGEEFREELSKVASAGTVYSDSLIQGILDASRRIDESKGRVSELEDALKALKGQADETTTAALKLSDAVATIGVNRAAFDEAEQAIRGVKDLLPDLAEEMKKTDKLAGLENFKKQILALGPATKETLDLLRRAEQAILTGTDTKSGARSAETAANKRKKEAEEQVNLLVERRRLLLEQIAFAESQGDNASTQTLLTELTAVDVALGGAIEKAIAFWEAIGGEEAKNKILALQGLQNTITQTGVITEISAKKINDNLIDGAVSGFDRFAQALANGENAITALKDSFLQFAADFLREIAQMILKQALLNALTGGKGAGGGGGAGGFIASVVAGLFHTGGIAGQAQQTRAADPRWFRNAKRYHTGGIAGLKPNEVPAILKSGEEILTEGDPRHVSNGGKSSGDRFKVVNMFDSASFLSESLNSSVGEQAVLNFVRANRGTIKQLLE